MRGIKYYNFPAFDEARDMLMSEGWDVLSPADLDRNEAGFDAMKLPPDTDWSLVPEGFSLDECIERDINAIKHSDALYMLDGWENSTGATAEFGLAKWWMKDILYQSEPSGEVRTTSATGGQKGVKLARFDLIPTSAIYELAEHHGKGAKKYGPSNWRKGYEWSKSFAALQRHAWSFWGGEDIDPETQSKHMTAVSWHADALSVFMDEHPAYDDRPSTMHRKNT